MNTKINEEEKELKTTVTETFSLGENAAARVRDRKYKNTKYDTTTLRKARAGQVTRLKWRTYKHDTIQARYKHDTSKTVVPESTRTGTSRQ